MTHVTPEDTNAMARILRALNGEAPEPMTPTRLNEQSSNQVELAGPGQITKKDVDAMASVMTRLNSLSNQVVDNMITEGSDTSQLSEALYTERTATGVKVGRYQIMIKEDAKRLAGKQFYSIYNSLTNDTIADDISLYETALSVVRLLNNGRFANSSEVRKLFEQDDTYTSHRIDALTYKRRLATVTDPAKRDIFESRFQASLDRCMAAKRIIKTLSK